MRSQQEIEIELKTHIETLENFIKDKEVHQFIDKEKSADFQYFLSALINYLSSLKGIDKSQFNEAYNAIQSSKRNGGYYIMNLQQLLGHLKFIQDAIRNNWLSKLRNEITADDLNSFLEYGQIFLEKDRKMESSVIGSAIFEDTVRRMGRNHDCTHKDLEQVINFLKSNGVIEKNEAKKFKYYAGIRNSALHANWDEFQIHDVKKMINDLPEVIESHINN